MVLGHTWSRLPWSCLFLADLRLEPSWEDELPPDIRRFLRLYKRVPVSEYCWTAPTHDELLVTGKCH